LEKERKGYPDNLVFSGEGKNEGFKRKGKHDPRNSAAKKRWVTSLLEWKNQLAEVRKHQKKRRELGKKNVPETGYQKKKGGGGRSEMDGLRKKSNFRGGRKENVDDTKKSDTPRRVSVSSDRKRGGIRG